MKKRKKLLPDAKNYLGYLPKSSAKTITMLGLSFVITQHVSRLKSKYFISFTYKQLHLLHITKSHVSHAFFSYGVAMIRKSREFKPPPPKISCDVIQEEEDEEKEIA